MPSIQIEKITRDCPYNHEIMGKRGARLIYDFDVIVDGERRAQIRSGGRTNREYRLSDAAGRAVHWKEGYHDWRGSVVTNKMDIPSMLAVMEHVIDAGKLPTTADIDAYRAERSALKAQEAAENAERWRVERIQRAGLALYDALKAIVNSTDYGADDDRPLMRAARAALAEAE